MFEENDFDVGGIVFRIKNNQQLNKEEMKLVRKSKIKSKLRLINAYYQYYADIVSLMQNTAEIEEKIKVTIDLVNDSTGIYYRVNTVDQFGRMLCMYDMYDDQINYNVKKCKSVNSAFNALLKQLNDNIDNLELIKPFLV